MLFPVSGVETPIWLPPLVAFIVSSLTSTAGVSGAFILLPFQMSYLGFTSPSVSPTNLVYNIVSIPSGVWRYLREGRMVWPLTWIVIAGTLPGVLVGAVIRLEYLPEPGPFKVFVACVLAYLAVRMFMDLRSRDKKPAASMPESFVVKVREFNWHRLRFDFAGQTHTCGTGGIFGLSLAVGMVGGVYGIGGGAIIAPFFMTIYRLPVHAVAGASLMGTFVTSIVGVVFFQAVAPLYAGELTVAPDWLLGGLFGLGGILGMYTGARLQRFMPAKWIKLLLALLLLFVAGRYVIDFIY